jgi:hypothetical protein
MWNSITALREAAGAPFAPELFRSAGLAPPAFSNFDREMRKAVMFRSWYGLGLV